MNETVLIAFLSFLGVLAVQLPAILLALKQLREMTALKIHVNSNTDRLVQSVKELATKTGHEEGRTAALLEGTLKADAVAVEVAKAVAVASQVSADQHAPDRDGMLTRRDDP